MTFNELVAEVYEITNRPDLSTETESAVKAATLKAHNTEFYSKDIVEIRIEFPSNEFYQEVTFVDDIAVNYRALSYLRRVENDTDEEGVFLDIITPQEILDDYGRFRNDVAYVAGGSIEIRSGVEFKWLLVGAYLNPVVTPAGSFSSWIADLYPYAIIHEAARKIFKSIGHDQQATFYRDLVAESYLLLKQNHTQDVGY